MTHHTISGVLSCYCTSVISRFSLFYDASQPRVTFHLLVKYSYLKDGIHFILDQDKQHNVVTVASIQVAEDNLRLFIGPVDTLVQWFGGFEYRS